MFGSDALLDSAGSGNEVDCFQGVLQRISNPRGSARTNANRNADIERHRLQLIPLAETLSRPISDTNGSMSTNSPGTGHGDDEGLRHLEDLRRAGAGARAIR